MCRAVISPGDACLEAVESYVPHSTSESEQNEVFISPKIREWQVEMARLLQRQRDRGGTIDLAAKDDTIDETWVCVCVFAYVCVCVTGYGMFVATGEASCH